MAPLASGTYSIKNARFHNVAVLLDDIPNSDIVGMFEANTRRETWHVSRLLDGTYIIKNHAYDHYACSAPGAGEGDGVYGGEREKQLIITETRVRGRYMISPVDAADLFWGLPDGEIDTPIALANAPTNPQNQWTFVPIDDTAYEMSPMSQLSAPDPSSGGSVSVGNLSQPPLRLLAFDGGGIRGLSSLFILQDIMEQIRRNQSLLETPHPCEFFDLIGGTSTGGLIAILLGRLRMSVDEAIMAYLALATKVFTTSIHRFLAPNAFDHERLEASIKDVVGGVTRDADSPMRDPREGRCCRTFVLALRKQHSTHGPTFLRTYTVPDADPAPCTIWQAGRATTAAPSFFKSVSVPISAGGVHADLVDAGMGYNNPSQQVLDEARLIWGEARQVGCLLSIGTGQSAVVGLGGVGKIRPSVLLRAAAAYAAIATDCERTHQSISNLVSNSPQFSSSGGPSYFRFNVDQGMQDVETEEWGMMPKASAYTQTYMSQHEVAERKSQCVKRLVAIAKP